VTGAPPSADGPPREQVFGNLVTAMSKLSGEDDLAVFLVQERDARCLAARS
jgi:hypothetical protein